MDMLSWKGQINKNCTIVTKESNRGAGGIGDREKRREGKRRITRFRDYNRRDQRRAKAILNVRIVLKPS